MLRFINRGIGLILAIFYIFYIYGFHGVVRKSRFDKEPIIFTLMAIVNAASWFYTFKFYKYLQTLWI